MGKLVGHEWIGTIAVECGKRFRVTIRAEMHDSRADHRKLGSPGLLDNGEDGRLHVIALASTAYRSELPLPNLSAGTAPDLDGVVATTP